jgi:hypothetical protein
MSRPSLQQVLTQLAGARAAPADIVERAGEALAGFVSPSPWFVRVLAGFGAWLAALFFMGFVSWIAVETGGALFLGAVFLVGSGALRRYKPDDFSRQFSLALCLAGQLLVIYALSKGANSIARPAMVALVLQIPLIAFYPDRTLRFLATVFAALAAATLVLEHRVPQGVAVLEVSLAGFAAWAWLREAAQGARETLLRPVAYGAAASLFLLLLPSSFSPWLMHSTVAALFTHSPVAPVGLALVLAWVAAQMMREQGRAPASAPALAIFAGIALFTLPALRAPGLLAALIVLAVGFRRGNRLLEGMSVLFLVWFLSAYYYHLSISLLDKSFALVASGAILLALRYMLLRLLAGGRT